MIPVSPMTVKFTDEERARVKEMATLLGWTESQVVRDSLAFAHQLIFTPTQDDLPRLVIMGRLACSHGQMASKLPQAAGTKSVRRK